MCHSLETTIKLELRYCVIPTERIHVGILIELVFTQISLSLTFSLSHSLSLSLFLHPPLFLPLSTSLSLSLSLSLPLSLTLSHFLSLTFSLSFSLVLSRSLSLTQTHAQAKNRPNCVTLCYHPDVRMRELHIRHVLTSCRGGGSALPGPPSPKSRAPPTCPTALLQCAYLDVRTFATNSPKSELTCRMTKRCSKSPPTFLLLVLALFLHPHFRFSSKLLIPRGSEQYMQKDVKNSCGDEIGFGIGSAIKV